MWLSSSSSNCNYFVGSSITSLATTLLPLLTSLGATLLSSSSNCNYVVGSSNMTCNYVAASSNITWSYVVIFFFKLQAVPISTGRRGIMTRRRSLPPLLFFLQNRKNSISPARNDPTKLPHGIATKKSFKQKQIYQNLTFETFCIKELIHSCQRRHARVPVEGMIMMTMMMLEMMMLMLTVMMVLSKRSGWWWCWRWC